MLHLMALTAGQLTVFTYLSLLRLRTPCLRCPTTDVLGMVTLPSLLVPAAAMELPVLMLTKLSSGS